MLINTKNIQKERNRACIENNRFRVLVRGAYNNEKREGTKIKKILSKVRKAIEDYDMISDGDKIAVGVSGGKDSLVLLLALSSLQKFYHKKFDLCAITVSLGFDGFDVSPIKEFCSKIQVPYCVCDTQISQIVFYERKEKSPCSLCANMRRGAINEKASELGCNKVALGHNKDDFIETSILRLFYEGNFKSFWPVTYLDKTKLNVIRPLIYVLEKDVKDCVKRNCLPIVKNPCPKDRNSKREDIKNLINDLAKENRNLKSNIFGAIRRSTTK